MVISICGRKSERHIQLKVSKLPRSLHIFAIHRLQQATLDRTLRVNLATAHNFFACKGASYRQILVVRFLRQNSPLIALQMEEPGTGIRRWPDLKAKPVPIYRSAIAPSDPGHCLCHLD